MNQNSELFVGLAEIAGVFVGFGALIAVSRRGSSDWVQSGRIRTVVVIGLVVMVAALIPVGLSRYGFLDRSLWLWSSASFLVLIWIAILVPMRNAEHRSAFLAQTRGSPVAAAFFWVFLELPVQVPLVLAVLGSHPDLEPAFYTTALVLNLFEAAFVLTQLVFAQPAGPPAA